MPSASQLLTAALKAGSPSRYVFQGLAPQDAPLPRIGFLMVDILDDEDLEGIDGGLREYRVQVDAWASDPVTAEGVAEEAYALMLAARMFNANSLSSGRGPQMEDVTRLWSVSRDFRVTI